MVTPAPEAFSNGWLACVSFSSVTLYSVAIDRFSIDLGLTGKRLAKSSEKEHSLSHVNQQFELAAQILAADVVPIVEPEVEIHCPEKAKAGHQELERETYHDRVI